jgi:Mg-chelatase subunit ChlD
LFLKSKYDGEPRDNRRLNSVIVLDISGSMSGGLRGSQPGDSRLQLCKEAIKMFVSKLRPTDAFGLVVFDDKGETIVPCTQKANLEVEAIFAMVDQIKTRGGTTLSSGFNEGANNLKEYLKNCAKADDGCENRIVMLTDVGDNSLATERNFIEKVSENDINVTIVGISDDFRSSTCEQLSNVRGFNYFCAVETSDLNKYLFENFDFTFFPCAYDIEVTLESNDVKFFNVYGTSDSD